MSTFEACGPHALWSGQNRHLRGRCTQDADPRKRLQIIGWYVPRSLRFYPGPVVLTVSDQSFQRDICFDAKLFVDCTLIPHLKEAYHSQLDRAGDYICLFGPSCGTMTAHALAGMVQKVGLLPPCNLERLPFAYAMYVRDDDAGLRSSTQSKRTFSSDVKIKLVGVWYAVRPSDRLPISYLRAGAQCTLLDSSRNICHSLAGMMLFCASVVL